MSEESSKQEAVLVSVIIPTLDEEACLRDCLQSLSACTPPFEVIVCDGGSSDRTLEIAFASSNVKVIKCPLKNRARQMNLGAESATGKLLWFVHADSMVRKESLDLIRSALDGNPKGLGAFRFALNAGDTFFRVIEAGVRLRCLLLKLPYGDQGYFLSKETFRELGGFPEVSMLEDLIFVRRAKKKVGLLILDAPLLTSARKWNQRGMLRVTLTHFAITLFYFLGASPQVIARFLRRRERRKLAPKLD